MEQSITLRTEWERQKMSYGSAYTLRGCEALALSHDCLSLCHNAAKHAGQAEQEHEQVSFENGSAYTLKACAALALSRDYLPLFHNAANHAGQAEQEYEHVSFEHWTQPGWYSWLMLLPSWGSRLPIAALVSSHRPIMQNGV